MKKLLFTLLLIIGFSCSSEQTDFNAENIAEIEAYISKNNLDAKKTVSDLYYIINSSGNGNFPTFNSNVTIAYRGYFLNQETFDASDNATFNLQGVIPGFSEAVTLLKPGGSGTFILPSKIGYGNSGAGKIKGGQVIIFDITLKSIN
ncbi:peptidylprolyl isomerase [Polaribacter aestuariivivens]|uniref:Peptidyl-prolyl cis-trans isomerase n=1 Tax=Polaribacter aestuariivivens TaxID=2304626 RepID=A0A5S3NAB7_9FLAO|nr:FKBP-type peptidyl-prolyl cis-trans isomerase [Polaribacter aestuariivivens]TMM32052.1 peptidylprolyl isomerase [Polaribacter aestuariivivens]